MVSREARTECSNVESCSNLTYEVMAGMRIPGTM